ncbi:UPF0687 protein C20orf27 homolog isoform X6 [Cygnus atratus]|uniref:UPF0687 protein C20orf27 homolog isoform X6 n=1 Tax=Cygnus atratus TaxID=8868 RepID=UPI0021B772E5|nr:UPF0687 protein C20orf27 homolog isoform X6 [Cygnus atratus]
MAALGPAAGNGGLRALYRWVDAVPLSRPRRNIARDFSDGVLAAELVKFFFPAMVQLHSYVPASSTPQKLANWGHLNRKVLSKLNFSLPDEVIRQVVQCRPGTVEQVLLLLRQKIEEKQKQSKAVPGPEQATPGRRARDRAVPRSPPGLPGGTGAASATPSIPQGTLLPSTCSWQRRSRRCSWPRRPSRCSRPSILVLPGRFSASGGRGGAGQASAALPRWPPDCPGAQGGLGASESGPRQQRLLSEVWSAPREGDASVRIA